jgi:hypothetical protein
MSINVLVSDLQDMVEEVISPDVLKRIGEELTRDIRTRTRMGNVVFNFGGEPSKITPLHINTIGYRYENSYALSSDTRPETSNLTMTGEMLSSVAYTVKKNTILLTIEGVRNQEIAKYHMEGNKNLPRRPFFQLDRYNIDRAELLILAAFDDFILRRWKNS